jgi:hypothetical protein
MVYFITRNRGKFPEHVDGGGDRETEAMMPYGGGDGEVGVGGG